MKRTLFIIALLAIALAPLVAARPLDIDGLCLNEEASVYINDEADHDADGVPTSIDNCPCVQNTDQTDEDADGIGDICDLDIACIPRTEVCDYKDNDCDSKVDEGGVCNEVGDPIDTPTDDGYLCKGIEPRWVSGQLDSDRDGVPDSIDNCQCKGNVGQEDTDGDGLGDACSTDVPEFGPVIMLGMIGMLGAALVFAKRK